MTSRDRVAQLIRQAADHSKLSNSKIARKAGLSKSTITEALRGTYGMKLETLERIAETCGCKLTVRLEISPTLPTKP